MFTKHARITSKKASKAVLNYSRILPNISAMKQDKKTLFVNVVHSMLLYGAPIWADKMSKAGMAKLNKVQKRIALKVASAYHTTSTDAVLVIVGILSIDLQASDRKKMYEEKGNNNIDKINEIKNTSTSEWQTK